MMEKPTTKTLENLLQALQQTAPLIHCITNPISINDCANAILAIGGRPIMAEHPREVAEITTLAQALSLNLGNITDARMESMGIAGKQAQKLNIPITIDLVGTACSSMRQVYASKLLEEITPQIIKGNISEIRAVCGLQSHSSGIDANQQELITLDNYTAYEETFGAWALAHNCTILISGPLDFGTDGHNSWLASNGSPMLASITGTGCMLNVLAATCVSVAAQCQVTPLEAALVATSLLGIAGEEAAQNHPGPGTFHVQLFDALASLTPTTLNAKIKLVAGK